MSKHFQLFDIFMIVTSIFITNMIILIFPDVSILDIIY